MKKNKPDEQIEETDSSEIQKLTKEELQKYTRFKQYKKDKKSDSFLSQLQKKYSRDTHRAQYAFVLSDKSLPKYLLDLSKSTYMMILLKQENKIIIDDIIPVIHRPHSSRIVFTSRPYYKLSEELSQEYGVEQMNKLIHFHWKFDVRLSQCDVVLKDFGFDLQNCPLLIAWQYRRKAYGMGIVLNKSLFVLVAPYTIKYYNEIFLLNNYNSKIGKKKVFLLFHKSGVDGKLFQHRDLNQKFGVFKKDMPQILEENYKWEMRHQAQHYERRKNEIMSSDGRPAWIFDFHLDHFDVLKTKGFGNIYTQKNEEFKQIQQFWANLGKKIETNKPLATPTSSASISKSVLNSLQPTQLYLQNLMNSSLLFLSKLSPKNNFILLNTDTTKTGRRHAFNLVFSNSAHGSLPTKSELMVHYTKSNFVRVRVKDRVYDYILSISHHAFFFLLIDEFFIMGQIDATLPEDILKIQFIFKDEIFRTLDEVYMDSILTENLLVKDFRVIPYAGLSSRFISELRTRKISKSIKKVGLSIFDQNLIFCIKYVSRKYLREIFFKFFDFFELQNGIIFF